MVIRAAEYMHRHEMFRDRPKAEAEADEEPSVGRGQMKVFRGHIAVSWGRGVPDFDSDF